MKTFFLFVTVLYGLNVFSQPAKVLRFSGRPHLVSGEFLKVGDKLKEGDAVLFTKSTDTLVVLVLERGIGYYTPGKDPRTAAAKTAEWRFILRDILWVKDETGNLVGRGTFINSLDDLRQFFSLYDKPASSLLVIDSLNLPVGLAMEKVLSKNYFFLQYVRNGDTINRKLTYRYKVQSKKSRLLIDTSLLGSDGKSSKSLTREKYTLNLYDRSTGSVYPVVSFYTSIISSDDIIPAMCLLKTDASDFKVLASGYLNWLYGSPEKNALDQFFSNLACH